MKDFNFPTNIKQVGTIESGLKIYMEDYVASYLTQYATAAGYDERLATLVGRYMQIDSVPVIFISGAILGKYAEEENGILKFTRKSMEYIDEQIEEHFSGMEVVGWMQSQPGYGTFLIPSYKLYHKQFFGKSFQVMFVVDPLEKINTFYANKYGELVESNGYFIYYEKNQNMHEYMMENKVTKQKGFKPVLLENYDPEEIEEIDQQTWNNQEYPQHEEVATAVADQKHRFFKEKTNNNTINFSERIKGRKNKNNMHDQDMEYEEMTHDTPEDIHQKPSYQIPKLKPYTDDIDDVVDINRAKTKKIGSKNHRRAINMLLSMSSVVLLVSFVMAAALLRSEDRINLLEAQLHDITQAHLNIMQSLQATQEVVAMVAVAGVETVDGPALANQQQQEQPQPQPQEQPQSQEQPEPDPVPNQIVPGNQIPGTSPQAAWPSIANLPQTYIIQPGDNLLTISQMFYGTTAMVDQIMYVNNIENQDMIFSGMILMLPNNYPN